MGWLEAHGLTLTLLLMLTIHWMRMEIRIAVIARDLQWMRAQLGKWGFIHPANGGN